MPVTHSSIIETLLISNQRLIRAAAQRTGSTVLSATWTALSVLDTDGPHRIGDLAKATRISQPGMTKIVNQLVEDEWVLRIADVEDSRAWLIAVTDKGRKALEAWRTELSDSVTDYFTDLTDTEWQTLDRAARILEARVARAAAAA